MHLAAFCWSEFVLCDAARCLQGLERESKSWAGSDLVTGAQEWGDLAHIFWAIFTKRVRVWPHLNTVELGSAKSRFPADSLLSELQKLKAPGNAGTRYSANVLQAGFLNGLLRKKTKKKRTSSAPNYGFWEGICHLRVLLCIFPTNEWHKLSLSKYISINTYI